MTLLCREGRGSIKMRTYANWGIGGLKSVGRFAYKFLKGLSRTSKKKRKKEKREGRIVHELWLKKERRSGAIRKGYH